MNGNEKKKETFIMVVIIIIVMCNSTVHACMDGYSISRALGAFFWYLIHIFILFYAYSVYIAIKWSI